jgi:radical SAM protein with 4Fe4S-binding SPASM domain
MTVNHLGDVYVCDTAFREGYRCGNVFRDGVAGAWRSAAWTSLRHAHRVGRPESHALCGRCLLVR